MDNMAHGGYDYRLRPNSLRYRSGNFACALHVQRKEDEDFLSTKDF